MNNADLRYAVLLNADLTGAYLTGAKFNGAKVTKAQAEYLESQGFSGFVIVE